MPSQSLQWTHKGSGGAPRRSLRSGRALRRSHRAASPLKIGQKSPWPSQNGLPNANHRHRPPLMPSQSLQWTHKGSGRGGAALSEVRKGASQVPSCSFPIAIESGQKSPRPSQNGPPNANHRHSPLLMPSQSLQWTHKGSGGAARRSLRSGRALRRSHRAASPLKIGQKSPWPSQNGPPNAKPMPLEEVHSSQIPPMDP